MNMNIKNESMSLTQIQSGEENELKCQTKNQRVQGKP